MHRSRSSTSTSAICGNTGGVAIDAGDQDSRRAGALKLHEILDSYGVGNTCQVYSGTHTSAVAVRFQNFVLPFSARVCPLARTAYEAATRFVSN